jgi:hypothetical protein
MLTDEPPITQSSRLDVEFVHYLVPPIDDEVETTLDMGGTAPHYVRYARP